MDRRCGTETNRLSDLVIRGSAAVWRIEGQGGFSSAIWPRERIKSCTYLYSGHSSSTAPMIFLGAIEGKSGEVP